MTSLKEDALDIAVPMIAKFEGCRLHAYQDSVGVWTIGYGHTKGVKPNDSIDQETASRWLREEVSVFMDTVMHYVHVPVNEHQLAALTSFAYNVGAGALKRSTLLRLLNSGRYEQAAHEFNKWTKAGGRVLTGLVRRRNEEMQEFLT